MLDKIKDDIKTLPSHIITKPTLRIKAEEISTESIVQSWRAISTKRGHKLLYQQKLPFRVKAIKIWGVLSDALNHKELSQIITCTVFIVKPNKFINI